MPQELDVGMAAIGKRIREQDNLATDAPMFIVQQVQRIYGLGGDYAEHFEWFDSDGDAADEELTEKLESRKASPKERKGWKRVGYIERWEYVTACFTREACEDYIACNGHNLKNPRIYADGSYRNKEFRAVREFLMSDTHVGYEDVVKIISAYPVTMLAGLFAEVTRLCINNDVFNKDGGMERVVARLKAECQK